MITIFGSFDAKARTSTAELGSSKMIDLTFCRKVVYPFLKHLQEDKGHGLLNVGHAL